MSFFEFKTSFGWSKWYMAYSSTIREKGLPYIGSATIGC
jgi:hypothetical protein